MTAATVKTSKSAADYIPNLQGCAAQGNNLVIGVGYLMGAPIAKVAKANPNTKFAIIDFSATDPKTINVWWFHRAVRAVSPPLSVHDAQWRATAPGRVTEPPWVGLGSTYVVSSSGSGVEDCTRPTYWRDPVSIDSTRSGRLLGA